MVLNIHERLFGATMAEVGQLIDGLASDYDALWPRDRWPPVRFDGPLGLGAVGGHGPIRYTVSAYVPGRLIEFQFTRPEGFEGHHRFEAEEVGSDQVRLRHILEMQTTGRARLTWPMVFQPLHDALLEDALDRAELHVGTKPHVRQWSPWVRFLRIAWGRSRRTTKQVEH